jgi:hypothetical protein
MEMRELKVGARYPCPRGIGFKEIEETATIKSEFLTCGPSKVRGKK